MNTETPTAEYSTIPPESREPNNRHQTNVTLPPAMYEWLAKALPGQRIHCLQGLAGGYSNTTILVITDTQSRYVLRRYLHRNTCGVEVALADLVVHLVPVPRIVAADPAGLDAGEPALLSHFVSGVLVSNLLPVIPVDEGHELGHAVGDALASIGTVSFTRPGFFLGADLDPEPVGKGIAAELSAFVNDCLNFGNAAHVLTPLECDALRALAAREVPDLVTVDDACQLVHSDFNPKNLIATRRQGRWHLASVLDWECAFSGSPLFDIANILRFEEEIPESFRDGFLAGFRAAGGHLPNNWRQLSQTLDLYALVGFLTRPVGHPFMTKAARIIRQRLIAAEE